MLPTIIFYVFVIPLCTLMHEIGHGIATVLSSNATAQIHLGNVNDTTKRNFKLGRLHFYLKWSYYGFCSSKGVLGKNQKLVSLIGGPLMSLLMVIILGLVIPLVSFGDVQSLMSSTAFFCGVQFLVTAIPVRYPRWMGSYYGQPSDGLQILTLLKEKY